MLPVWSLPLEVQVKEDNKRLYWLKLLLSEQEIKQKDQCITLTNYNRSVKPSISSIQFLVLIVILSGSEHFYDRL